MKFVHQEGDFAPFDVEIEMALLGAIMVDNNTINVLAAELQPEHFYDPLHQRLYTVMTYLVTEGAVTPLIVASVVKTDPAWADLKMTAIAYLAALVQAAPAMPNIRDLARLVRDYATRRELIAIGEGIVREVYEAPHTQPARVTIGRATERLLSIGDLTARKLSKMGDAAGASLKRLEDRLERARTGERPLAITTGSRKLDKALGGLLPGDRVGVAARSQMGKAQPLDSLVLTPTGWVPMGEIRVGDAVTTPDGGFARVTHTHPQGLRQVYRITFTDGREVEACAEHLWRVRGTYWKGYRTVSTAQIKKAMKSVRHQGRLFLDLIRDSGATYKGVPIAPYLLGALIGDGGITHHPLITNFDQEVINQCAALVPHGTTLIARRKGTYGICGRRSGGRVKNPLTESLKALGLFGLGSHQKFIPQIYLNGSREQRTDMLRGLLDTDGTVEASGTVRYCTTSTRLRDDFITLVRSLGGIAVSRVKKTYCKDAHIVTVRIREAWRYFSIARKLARLPVTYTFENRLALAIKSVKKSRVVQAKCITIDSPEHLYVTDGFVVTHNSMAASSMSLAAAMAGAPVLIASADMREQQWAERVICDMDRHLNPELKPIHYRRFRTGMWSEDEWERIVLAQQALAGLPMFIDDNPAASVESINGRARALAQAHPGQQGLLVADFLQKIAPPSQSGYRDRRRDEDVTAVAYGLGDIVKPIGWSLMALIQIKSDIDAKGALREDPPAVTTIRESAGIEMAFDILFSPFRLAFFIERRNDPIEEKNLRLREPCVAGWSVQNHMRLIGWKNRDGSAMDLNLDLWCDPGSAAVRDEEPRKRDAADEAADQLALTV